MGRQINFTDITTAWTGPVYAAAEVTRKAGSPGSYTFMQADFDSSSNLIRTYDISSGRLDLYGIGTAGAPMVVALNATSPANGNQLGHYAYRGKNTDNVLYSTWAYMLGTITDVTPATSCSSLTLAVMRNANTTPGNVQPNFNFVIDGSGASGSVTFPTGAITTKSGNETNTAAAGPTYTFANSANSRNLIVGVTDNFNGCVDATGGGSLNLKSAGTTGISITSVGVTTSLPVKIAQESLLAKTSNYTLVAADAGSQCDNLSAVAEVDFTLPTGANGMRFGFTVVAAQILKVIAPASVTINVGGAVSAAAGNIASSQVGAYVELIYVTTNKWQAKMVTGTGGTAGAGGWTVT